MHKPVLVGEVLDALECGDKKVYLDCTVGYGGHAEAILERSSPEGVLIGVDRDEDALACSKARLKRFASRVFLFHGRFADAKELLAGSGFEGVDGVLLDLGVSSAQLDMAGRGFSFRMDGPLDMRMDRTQSLTAEEIVNEYSEQDLADIIYYYGGERRSRKIASWIVQDREKERIVSTGKLAGIVRRAAKYKSHRIDPATRTFQGLRIATNSELEQLEDFLEVSFNLLNPGGRLCVISYHSLEDRIVKHSFRRWASQSSSSEFSVRIINKKPIVPSDDECKENPRSRSAKLRIAEKREAG